MKKIAVLSFSFISLCATAQNVNLQTGQKITGATTMSVDMDMGIAGQMKLESSANSVINITGGDTQSYKANNTITKMKMSEDAGFLTMNYDSEDKSDTSSELAKTMMKSINQPIALFIDKKNGAVKEADPEKPKEEESGNPLSSIMGDAESPTTATQEAFFVIPAGKKAGDKWIDSTGDGDIRAVRTYEFQSLKNNIAVVAVNAVTKLNIQQESQGAQFTIKMDGTSLLTMSANISTGLVQKTNTKGSMEGTIEIMGQSMPVTMTISSESVFQ